MVRMLAGLFVLAGAAAFAADPIDTRTLDKSIVATLRDVHDRGADLYNLNKDYTAAYRLYEGSLMTVKPLLGHRADVQKTIESGLGAANREDDVARKAFLLHETIEKVRADLKAAPLAKPPIDPVTKKEPAPLPKAKEPEPKPKAKEPEPKPKLKEPEAKPTTAAVSGKVTVQGKPLTNGSITFVSLDLKAPKVVTATAKDGTYTVKDLPPGKYAVAISSTTAGAVPAKFATTDTSGLTYTAQAGTNQYDIELK